MANSFRTASYPHTYDRVRLIAVEERMTTELWRGLPFGGLGELVYAFELLLGASTALISFIGVLLCLTGANGRVPLDEQQLNSASENHPSIESVPFGEDAQVTIRLEPVSFQLFRRHRCVVTIREPLAGAADKNREVWYAEGDR
jgi:hypothetical protein